MTTRDKIISIKNALEFDNDQMACLLGYQHRNRLSELLNNIGTTKGNGNVRRYIDFIFYLIAQGQKDIVREFVLVDANKK